MLFTRLSDRCDHMLHVLIGITSFVLTPDTYIERVSSDRRLQLLLTITL